MFDLEHWRNVVATDLTRLVAAFVLAFPIAWDREKATQIMGMRTFSLVALGACAYVLVGEHILPDDSHEARARIIQGLLAGIGFLGAGAILKREDQVKGTATAASIWMTGAVGAAVGHGQYGLALTLSVMTFVLLKVLSVAHARHLRQGGSHPDSFDR